MFNDITPNDITFDRQIRKEIIKDHKLHGRPVGDLRNTYYFCDECQVGWGSLPPYKNVEFKNHGIWYSIARTIKGLMPACPDCQKRDHVHKLNRYKKKKYTVEEKARLNAEYGRSAKIYTGEDNDKNNR